MTGKFDHAFSNVQKGIKLPVKTALTSKIVIKSNEKKNSSNTGSNKAKPKRFSKTNGNFKFRYPVL